ncbi:uncharacterized mitochondrial protein-like protein [Tanacetum coccineum]
MSTLKFAETHNLVAFLEKPEESNGFEEIIDFLNASSVQYALTVNPTIYTTCIEQFWTSAKVKTVYGERQIQALVDKKKVIISETSIRSDLKLDDADGTDCLPTATIFAELERIGAKTTSWNKFSSTMAFAIICLATNQKFNLSKYIFDNMVKNLDEDMGADSATPTDSHSTPIITQPSSSKHQKKKSRRKQRKDNAPTKPTTEETTHEEHVSTPSYDPHPSGEDRMQLDELMIESQAVGNEKEVKNFRAKKVKKDLDADAEGIEFEKVVEEPIVSVATTTKSIPVSVVEVVTTASAIKDKGKGKIVEPEVPLKKKDQVALDEEMARNLEAQLQAELIKEEMLARQKEEEANIALIKSWDNTQAMTEADFELAQRLQAKEQGEITIEEILRFDTKIEESFKRAGDKLESDMSKKQKIDEHVEVEKDDQEEAEMKRHIEIVKDDEVAIDAIPLVTKPPVIVEYKIDKDGRMGYFKLIRADGSSKRYSSMINMLQGIDREDLETWKLVKAKHENTRPEEDYERVLWVIVKRSLYGLKQAPRAWFQWFASYITRVGFHHSWCDSSLFIYHNGMDTTYLLLNVDDIVLTTSFSDLLHRIISYLHLEFAMTDLGSLNYFLGISVARDSSGMFLSQKKYAVEILKRAGMVNCNPNRTPVDTESKLGTIGDVVSDPTMYQSLASSLQYLTFTRPDNCHMLYFLNF